MLNLRYFRPLVDLDRPAVRSGENWSEGAIASIARMGPRGRARSASVQLSSTSKKARTAFSKARRKGQACLIVQRASMGLKHGTNAMSGSVRRTISPRLISAAGFASRTRPYIIVTSLRMNVERSFSPARS